jgi:hypothetical protein
VLVAVVMVCVLPIVRASGTAIAVATRAISPRAMSILARCDKPLDLFEEEQENCERRISFVCLLGINLVQIGGIFINFFDTRRWLLNTLCIHTRLEN